MFALVESGKIKKYFSGNQGITIGDNKYPNAIFSLWSKDEREAIGIYEVETDSTNYKDEKWYINTNESFTFGSGKVTRSWGTATAKAHADTLWTSKDKTDGNIPEGKDVGDVAVEGLKTQLIRTIKQQAAGILQDTDWYIIRKADAGTAVPSSITTHRAAVRTKAAEMETAITNASDTPALEALYTNQDKTDNKIPDDKDVGDVKSEGLKTVLIKNLKSQAAAILRDTDWYIIRKADAGTAVPSSITTHRAAVRTKAAEMETAITNAADTPALETLYTYTKQEDGSVTRPLGELPRLES